jgi:hypothetical protein
MALKSQIPLKIGQELTCLVEDDSEQFDPRELQVQGSDKQQPPDVSLT